MPYKVKIEVTNNLKQSESAILDKIHQILPNFYAIDINLTDKGAVLYVDSEDTVTTLLCDATQIQLLELNLRVVPHERFFPDRTVFATKVRQAIVDEHTTEEIIDEINRLNDVNAIKIFAIKPKDGNTTSKRVLKIIFETKQNVEDTLTNGLKLYNSIIPGVNISKEKFTAIKQCYKCFKFTHYSSECHLTEGFCSICGDTHNYKVCPNKNKPKCINCKGKHIAIAASCPLKKAEVKKATTSTQISNTSVNTGNSQLTNTGRPSPDIVTTQTKNHWFPQPSQPSQPSQPIKYTSPIETNNNNGLDDNSSSLKSHEWEIKLKIMESYAQMRAKDDHEKYLLIMNAFLINHGISPLESPIIITPVKHSSSGNHNQNSISNLSQNTNQHILPPLSQDPPSLPTINQNTYLTRQLFNRTRSVDDIASLNLALSPNTFENETLSSAASVVSLSSRSETDPATSVKKKRTPRKRKCKNTSTLSEESLHTPENEHTKTPPTVVKSKNNKHELTQEDIDFLHQQRLNPDWSYLDVSTSQPPSSQSKWLDTNSNSQGKTQSIHNRDSNSPS